MPDIDPEVAVTNYRQLVFTIGLLAGSTSISAETFTITAQGISMNPLVVTIQPGDTVSWTGMNVHNTMSVDALLPSDTEGWESTIGEDYQHTFVDEGIYIYQCKPHSNLGMGGAIIVGQPVNLQAIKAANVTGPVQKIVTEAINAAENL